MASEKSTFAVFLGNRGFFPASLMASAREDLTEVLHGLGHEALFLDGRATT
jgi:L-fucose isomerase-like protein